MKKLLFIIVLFGLNGCNTLKNVPGLSRSHADSPAQVSLPDDYTVTGTTKSDFDVVSVRTEGSAIIARIQLFDGSWYECDQFETLKRADNTVRFWYRNLSVNGASRPIAPKGTKYEVRSIRLESTGAKLY